MRSFRRACAALGSLLLVGAAAAAPITKLGVMTVLGREMDIVIRAQTTGTHLDRNARETVKLGPGDFENFVLQAVATGARREGLGEALVLIRPADGSMPWRREGQAVLVTRSLLDAAVAAKLSHLVLIQPARDDAKLQLHQSTAGSGRLEGLGFYLDPSMQLEITDSVQRATGFVAPYAYFDMYLVDVATLDLQAEYRSRASRAVTDPGLQGANMWEALSSMRKMQVMRELLQVELDKALAEWVRPAPASAAPGR